ncbi:TonB-dependent siderophore receptor [Chitinophaga sp. 212800010-3]|uniref:TonB-dependent siderophore receptor n=1 Tax=unclassified Chitinophaga TaxID=2619133 RepID=UPI002DE69AD8|nr:TonB-dependent siderophore receptor [Chitinophaga sp. 212800010-3]
MKKSFLILILLNTLSVASMAQHQADSLRKAHLREIEIQEKKKKLKADSISPTLRITARSLEMPQNITGVSQELIQQQGGLVMKDIVRNAAGVHMGYNSSLFDASNLVFMRGFPAPTYVNGLLQRTTIDDAAIIESVEFIKGPAGFLASAGEPGGAMNLNTKVPAARIRNIEIAGGSFNLWRGAADLGSAIKSKGFSYRLNAAYQTGGSFLDFQQTRKYVIAPVVQYNFSPRSMILTEYNLIRMTSDGGSGVTKVGTDEEIRTARVRDNYGGDPGLPLSYGETQSIRLLFNHSFNDRWKLVLQSKYTSTPVDSWYLLSDNQSPVNFNAGDTTRRQPVRSYSKGEVVAAQAYVKGIFNTGKQLTHYLLTGVDYNYAKDVYSYATGRYSFFFDRRHPRYGLNTDSARVLDEYPASRDENNWWSVFAYDMIHLGPRWRLNAGGRYTINTRTGKDQQNAFSPRLGITWLLRDNISIYALYDQSFIPQNGQDFYKNNFKPLKGNDIEIGAKGEWWNRRLSTNVTVYRIIKNNLLVSDMEHSRYRRQVGQATSTGIEADVIGQVSNRISVSVNYAYTHAVISKDTKKENEGTALPFMPQQLINAWVQYSIPVSETGRIRLSAGETTVVKPGTYTPGTYLPGYTKFDAGAAYDAGKWYIRVVADNITNKQYFTSGDILVGSIFPDVKTTYYVDGAPANFKIFLGIKL